MPKRTRLSPHTKHLALIGSVIAIVLGISVTLGLLNSNAGDTRGIAPSSTTSPSYQAPAPTDTVEIGAIDAFNDGKGQDQLLLVQRGEKGEKYTSLILDENSYCSGGKSGIQCMAMSITFSTVFSGKRALVDGNRTGDSILVRKLRVYDGDEIPLPIDPGTVYIPWMQAINIIKNCETETVMQLHTGDVNLVLKDGRKFTAIQPVIDDVFKITNEATAKCGPVGVGTE